MKNLKLKAARAEKDLSQADLAEKVGVSRQTISAIEKGDYNPTINLCITSKCQGDGSSDTLHARCQRNRPLDTQTQHI